MLNRFVAVGRLTKEIDLRHTQNGKAVANFTIAVNRPFTNQNGERDADFINCVAWGKQAENLAQFMKKGNQIGVDGRLQTRTYDDKDGKTVFVTEVVADSVQFLESKGNKEQGNQQQNNQQENQQQANPFEGNGQPIDIQDQDLPF